MPQKISAIRGMEDLLPGASALWLKFEDACRSIFEQYGYRYMRTPIVEFTPLFVRGLGEVTDIVEKEMYVFDDRNGESLALRPEATAGIVRSAIEHNFLYNGPQRVWTAGPMYRYERPQKGRQREFHQFDVEALGFEGPDVDAEQIVMLSRLWKRLGLAGIELQVNSIGDKADRKEHRAKLVEYFERHPALLDEDAKRRLHSNPLRILDSKNPAMQEMIEGAPKLADHLGEGARQHFDALQGLLRGAGVAFRVNPRLVRGMDYYNRTVFEFVASNIGAQSTVAGGGRYDGLFEQLGGKATPACGFGMGIERMMLVLEASGFAAADELDAFVVFAGAGGSFKSQMKKADASGARYALIVGEDEVKAQRVTLKPLRGGGSQETLEVNEVLRRLKQTIQES